MTGREFAVPASVAANIARRHAARTLGLGCLYGCRAEAHLYPGGSFCADHAPSPTNPTPDPALTLAGLRARAGIPIDATFLPSHTAIDQRAIDSGRRVSGARRRAAHDETLDERFARFHQQNPHVMARLVELVADATSRGHKRIGIGALFEQLRWSGTETNGNDYRLDNSLRAPYVRALVAAHPEWTDAFETRERKSA